MKALLDYLTKRICEGSMKPETARSIVLLAQEGAQEGGRAALALDALKRNRSAAEAAQKLGVSRATLYRMAAGGAR